MEGKGRGVATRNTPVFYRSSYCCPQSIMLSQVGFERIPLGTPVTWTQQSSRNRKTSDGEQDHCGDQHRAEESHSNISEEENEQLEECQELTEEVEKVCRPQWSWSRRPHRVKVSKALAARSGIRTYASQKDCNLTTAPWTARPSWQRLLGVWPKLLRWWWTRCFGGRDPESCVSSSSRCSRATSCSCHPQTAIPA